MTVVPFSQSAVAGKVVILRTDFNVPLSSDGEILEYTRIKESVPTIKLLRKFGAKRIHILSHLGRPKGKKDTRLSLQVVVDALSAELGETVHFSPTFEPGHAALQLHENVRFWAGETTNSPSFIKKLMEMKGEVFINDGFAISHRSHASVTGLSSFLPSYAGLLVQKEIEALYPFVKSSRIKGCTFVVGGAKMETKISVVRQLCLVSDTIIIGGAIAHTFLVAEGKNIGNSWYEKDMVKEARSILQLAARKKTKILLPIDAISNTGDTVTIGVDVQKESMFYDIGPQTIKLFSDALMQSKQIIWNGPMGIFEKPLFKNGTQGILKSIAANKSAKTVLGGGDTLSAMKQFGVEKTAFTHVSTGGGAMLQYLEGEDLPGIEVLTHSPSS